MINRRYTTVESEQNPLLARYPPPLLPLPRLLVPLVPRQHRLVEPHVVGTVQQEPKNKHHRYITRECTSCLNNNKVGFMIYSHDIQQSSIHPSTLKIRPFGKLRLDRPWDPVGWEDNIEHSPDLGMTEGEVEQTLMRFEQMQESGRVLERRCRN